MKKGLFSLIVFFERFHLGRLTKGPLSVLLTERSEVVDVTPVVLQYLDCNANSPLNSHPPSPAGINTRFYYQEYQKWQLPNPIPRINVVTVPCPSASAEPRDASADPRDVSAEPAEPRDASADPRDVSAEPAEPRDASAEPAAEISRHATQTETLTLDAEPAQTADPSQWKDDCFWRKFFGR